MYVLQLKLSRVFVKGLFIGLMSLACHQNQVQAGLIFNFRGTIFDVYNPAGMNPFGASAVNGTMVGGSFAYDESLASDSNFGTFASWTLPVTPGGPNQMELLAPDFRLKATSNVIAQGYDDPAQNLGGFDFQFMDSDTSNLNSSGLPSGFTLRNAGFLLSFVSDDPALSTMPNLPTSFDPLSQWNASDPFLAPYGVSGAFGFAFVDVFNANGNYVDTAFASFSLESVTAVPEPGTCAFMTFVVAVGIIWKFRKNALHYLALMKSTKWRPGCKIKPSFGKPMI